jgi:hypothetical protein
VHVGQQIEEIQGSIKIRNAQIEHALAKQFYEELTKFKQQSQREEDRWRRVEAVIAKHCQAAEEKLKRAKSTDAQIIFDTEMEAIRHFQILTPPQENTLGILTIGNQNPPLIPPTRPGTTAPPSNINVLINYFEYYSKIL